MQDDKPFIVFSTFNNSITELVKYASDYVVYDQSDISSWQLVNQEFDAEKRKNVGHSLANIFEFIISNWDELPSTVTFLKANVVPRHCDLEYFEKNINNGFYSHFYNDSQASLKSGINEVLFPGFYLEVNNSWYMAAGNHGLFCSYDEMATSIFQNYFKSNHILFGPGACFTVTSAQIKKHPRVLYELLEFTVSYQFFPEEAYIVERMIPMIFFGTYECNSNIGQLLNDLKSKPLTNTSKCTKHPSFNIVRRILEKLKRHKRRHKKT